MKRNLTIECFVLLVFLELIILSPAALGADNLSISNGQSITYPPATSISQMQPSNASGKSDSILSVPPVDMMNLSNIMDAKVLDIPNTTRPTMMSVTALDKAEAKAVNTGNDNTLKSSVTRLPTNGVLEENIPIPKDGGTPIIIDNGCCKDIFLLIVFQQPDGLWAPSALYLVGGRYGVLWDDYGILMTNNPTIYIYAYAPGVATWSGSDNMNIHGTTYPMRKETLTVDEHGYYSLRLWGCPEDCCNPIQCKGETKVCHCGCITD